MSGYNISEEPSIFKEIQNVRLQDNMSAANNEKLFDIENIPIVIAEENHLCATEPDRNYSELDENDMPENVNSDRGNNSNPTDTNNSSHVKNNGRRTSRILTREPYKWKREERKRKYQAGEEHVNSRKKLIRAKEMETKKNCSVSCKFKCEKKFNEHNRQHLLKKYYGLDQNGKYHYISRTTEREITKRKTTETESRRNYSFRYYFFLENQKFRVCKTFYLSTLNISQKPVYNVHKKKDPQSGIIQPDMRGKLIKKLKISQEMKEYVMEHIRSFPVVESHYCRARTSKQYLEATLNITKMYNLYLDKCRDDGKEPVKASLYRQIFCTKFNYGFHKPKSDRCPVCEKERVAVREKIQIPEGERELHDKHIQEKNKMREIRDKDRKGNIPVLTFDLQNVITCPGAQISPLFYFKKLNLYNLTAHFSVTKKVYCALWTEYTSGRSGNDIASAFIKILEEVVADHEFEDLITYSDSCVPQNRNSHISIAILTFLRDHPNLNSITCKYSIPGHSALQEVDSTHSVIERALGKNEFFSPLGVVRILKQINKTNPYRIIQMQSSDFKLFSEAAKLMNFKLIPFSSVTELIFKQNEHYEIEYKTSYCIEEYTKRSIKSRNSTSFPNVGVQPSHSVNSDKQDHIIKMLCYMSLQDREYYKVIFKITDDRIAIENSTTKNASNQHNTHGKEKGNTTLRKTRRSKKCSGGVIRSLSNLAV